jgi:hypothetical protein
MVVEVSRAGFYRSLEQAKPEQADLGTNAST